MTTQTAQQQEPGNYRYWAFLSYSHTDKKWGDWLHRALETYRVPKRLIGKDSRDGKVPARVFPIFRDREELPVSADLSANISEALHESRYLIVICSPRAAKSRWVNEEILTFKRMGRENRVLALIVDGEPNASDPKPGFSQEDECFPPAMRFYLSPDGEISAVRSEPIAADVRAGMDGKNNARLKLLAGLIAANYDELKQRDHTRRIRRLRTLIAVALVLIASFAGLSFYAWVQANIAKNQKSRAAFAEASRLLDQSQPERAMAYLARAVRLDPGNQSALTALYTLLIQKSWRWPADGSLRDDIPVLSAAITRDRARAITVSQNNIPEIWDLSRGRSIARLPAQLEPVTFAALSGDGKKLIIISGGRVCVWDVVSEQPLTRPFAEKAVWAKLSADNSKIVVLDEEAHAQIWDSNTGGAITSALGDEGDDINYAEFSPNSALLAISSGYAKRAWVRNAFSGDLVAKPLVHRFVVNMARFSPDGRLVATASDDGTARVWDVATGDPIVDPLEHEHTDRVHSISFSPDSNRVVTASDDRTAKIWIARTGQWVNEALSHSDDVTFADFSGDGMRVGTACADGTARVWDAKTSKPITELLYHHQPVQSVALSGDGVWMLSIGENTVRLWDVRLSEKEIDTVSHAASIPTNAPPPPDWLPLLAEGFAGLKISDKGVVEHFSDNPLTQLRSQLARNSKTDFWDEFGRWFFAGRSERTVAPGSTKRLADLNNSGP
jgi:WD40 repeat protein